MGADVMIRAGICALSRRIAKLAEPQFPLLFAVSAVVKAPCACADVKMSTGFPYTAEIGMILKKLARQR